MTITTGSETAPARRGIPTTYRGTRFRSRLEARWAAFFDLVEWSWIYEPFDADSYIPDFLITGPRSFLVEVGPVYSATEYEEKAQKADRAAASLGRSLLVVGVSAVADLPGGCFDVPAAGWLGEYGLWTPWDNEAGGGEGAVEAPGFAWGRGNWGLVDDRLNIWHDVMSYGTMPGVGRGDDSQPADDRWIMDRWSEAGNRVQWRGR